MHCVVIISDTRQELAETVTEAICHTESCILVHVHADKGADRMVASFVGSPETVVEGALNAAVIVQRSVDMRYHKGKEMLIMCGLCFVVRTSIGISMDPSF